MDLEIDKLKKVWDETEKKSSVNTLIPKIKFDRMINSLMSLGPFYYYIIDFYDMSLSHVSQSIKEVHGFDPETVTFDSILGTIHPDDLDFVAKVENSISNFFYTNDDISNILNYKMNYSFRSRMKNGEYSLLNHQAIILTIDKNGGFGKSLNIHTNINHITTKNNYTYSLIGLKENPSYTDIKVDHNVNEFNSFSKREIEIIKLISEGNNTSQIAEKLHISENTVKTHRKNINKKSDCKNATELTNKCISIGLI